MGYVPEETVYRLVFEDRPGLEVRATSLPVGEMLALAGLADLAGRNLTAQDAPRVQRLFRVFADALVSWNVERPAGVPVPASMEGLLALKQDFVLDVIKAWTEAVAGVAAPLPRPSSGGVPSLEGSIPMEPLSPSPVS